MRGQELLLKVNDAGARYPVTIDPYVQLAELTASDGMADDDFGFSAAISGNTVVVGAPEHVRNGLGAAYVFVKPASGWQNITQTAKLTASDASDGEDFGYSVAITGNTVVVGAPDVQVNGNYEQGAAYVFVEPPTGWADMTETAELTASDGTEEDFFGSSVAVDSNTIIVGAEGWNMAVGKAYVFIEPAGGWSRTSTFRAELTASAGLTGYAFESSVSISGNTVAIGSAGVGVAYVFVKPAHGWVDMTQTARLTATIARLDDVVISGNVIVAGSPSAPIHGQTYRGAVYIFVEPVDGWVNMTQTAQLTASDGASNDGLGASVSISGSTVVAGSGYNSNQGAVYLFREPVGGWTNGTQSAELTASNGAPGDLLGTSVGINGNTVVGGAPYAAVNGNSEQGAAYIFGP